MGYPKKPPPIAKLSEEPFILILKYILEEEWEEYAHIRTSLALVAKTWSQVVDHTPSLWTTIDDDHTEQQINRALAKSEESPLNIHFCIPLYVPPPVFRSFTKICQHIHRWANVSLRVERDHVHMLSILASPAPFLQYLTIRVLAFGQPFDNSEPVDIFQGHAPLLRSMSIGRLPIPWIEGVLSGLNELDLQDLGPDNIGLAAMMTVLDASPDLLIVKLTKVHPRIPDDPPPFPLHLPQLQELRLDGLEAEFTSYLLANLEALPPHIVVRDFNWSWRDQTQTFAALPHHLANIVQDNEDDIVTIQVTEGSIVYSYSSPSHPSFLIEFYHPYHEHILLQRLIPILPPHSLTFNTELRIIQDRVRPRGIDDWLPRWQPEICAIVDEASRGLNVTSLIVEGEKVESTLLLEYLGKPQHPLGGWALVSLRNLDIDVRNVPPGLLTKMVQNRRTSIEFKWARNTPAAFTHLHVRQARRVHRKDRKAIERIAGSGVLVWEKMRWRRPKEWVLDVIRTVSRGLD